MITQSRLKELFNYNKNTGELVRIEKRRKAKIGELAGNIRSDGYTRVKIDNKSYYAHRLVWLYVYGSFPKELDHIDGNRSNNCILNLRECFHFQNNQNQVSRKNTSSKYIGVCFNKASKKWQAYIMFNYKKIHLGLFVNEDEAYESYCNAKKRLHTFNPIVRSC
jgi:hypothetical protein